MLYKKIDILINFLIACFLFNADCKMHASVLAVVQICALPAIPFYF